MSAPEKSFFTLEEIIERWKKFNIDHQTLLDYARRDKIVFSVYLRDIGSHIKEIPEPDGSNTTRISKVTKFTSLNFPEHPIRYIKSDDARRILEAKDSEKVAVSYLYQSTSRNSESATCYARPKYFTPDDLFITKHERDKFEKKHKIKVSGKIEQIWAWLTNSSNQKALQIIGGFLAATILLFWQIYNA